VEDGDRTNRRDRKEKKGDKKKTQNENKSLEPTFSRKTNDQKTNTGAKRQI
jgi:hypothetical protein